MEYTFRYFRISPDIIRHTVMMTATNMGRPTGKLAALAKDKPGLEGLRSVDAHLVILGGGLPIKMGDAPVGGIGIDAPGGHLDDACAKDGVEAINGR